MVVWLQTHTTTVTYITDYCSTVERLLEGAKKEVKVALFLMRYDEKNGCPQRLVRLLAEARERGAVVEVYLEDDNYNKRAERYLLEHNVPVYHTKKFLHAKVVKVDDCFVVGSHNWTWSGLHRNIEASVLVCNSSAIERFFRELEGWRAAQPAHRGA